MSEAMSVDRSAPPSVAQTPQPEPPRPPPPPAPPSTTADEIDPELMAILARTQNNCFAEMGYYPSLLQEHRELKKQFGLQRNDNQKLYADNYNLVQRINAQEQRIRVLSAPTDQQKRALDELQERVRRVTAERDELSGRLHLALNEVMILRQELSRFIPNAVIVPAHERMAAAAPPPPVAHPRVISLPMMPQTAAAQPPPIAPYAGRPQAPQQQQQQQQPQRPVVSHHAHRPSHPALSPIDTSPAPTIASHRRPSAPASLLYNPSAAASGPSSASASPLAGFSGLSLASPSPGTPVSARPSTAGAPATAPPAGYTPRPVSAPLQQGMHLHSIQPQRVSPSSLAGAFIDLTGDSEYATQPGSRKRRKTDQGPGMAAPPPQAVATHDPVPNGPVAQPVPSPINEPRPSEHHEAPPAPPAPPNSNPPPEQPMQQPSAAGQPPSDPPPQPPDNDVVMEQESTLEEDCIEASFDEDDEDENKLWCTMCRSRYKAGHTSEVPQPFVNASQQELIAHCENVHPRGWEILKQKVAEQREAEAAAA
ncbi:hypothetical protein C8Q77DRAFT_1154026 [Trametes polyzona]|nr:hypothetical protein C8Q77DRAFT_1154026 [Trametes polyzona]